MARPADTSIAAAPTTQAPSQKPKITEVTASMIVGRSSFPGTGDKGWNGPRVDPHGSSATKMVTATPEECAPIVDGPVHKGGRGIANLRDDNRRASVELVVPTTEPDYAKLVQECPTITRGNKTIEVKPLPIADLPTWAASASLALSDGPDQALGIWGAYRGVLIFVEVSQDGPLTAADTAAGAKIFNDQVAQLESV